MTCFITVYLVLWTFTATIVDIISLVLNCNLYPLQRVWIDNTCLTENFWYVSSPTHKWTTNNAPSVTSLLLMFSPSLPPSSCLLPTCCSSLLQHWVCLGSSLLLIPLGCSRVLFCGFGPFDAAKSRHTHTHRLLTLLHFKPMTAMISIS